MKKEQGASRKHLNSHISELKEKALSTSIKEGSADAVSSRIASNYITPFALLLNAQAIHIGILNAISGLFAPLAQLFGSKLMENHSRKNIVTKFVFLQAITWLPIAIVSYLYWKGIFQSSLLYVTIALYTLFVVFANIAYSPWFSWMGDIVPENSRGKYFAKRNSITEIVGIITILICAFALDAFKTRGLALLGFSILFLFASLFKLISYGLLKKQYSPELKIDDGYYFSFFSFLKRNDNFGKFAIYNGVFYFAIMVASPFFAVYMLKTLNFDYAKFIAISISSSVFYLLFQPVIGKFSDKYGNKKLLIIGNIFFALTPIFWIFSTNFAYLLIVPQAISGLANAAYNISFTNFTYSAVKKPEHRALCVSYANILIGAGTFVGSILGGLILSRFDLSLSSSFFILFGIASSLRILAGIIFLPAIKDEKENIKKLPQTSFSLLHPIKTLSSEVRWFRAAVH